MTEKITVGEALPKSSVQTVETPTERITRLLLSDINRVTALVVIVLGLIGAFFAMILSESLRGNAFQLFSTIVSAALGFFFGSRGNDK